MVFLIDNYDSFVYNLADYIGDMGWEPAVYRNDALSLGDIEGMAPTHIVLSPGPCTPLEAGISNDVIRYFSGRIPILGVCLGHQCIGQVFGGRVVRARLPMHGKASLVHHDGRGVLEGLPSPLPGGRYHSLVIEPSSVPDCLEVSARTEDGEIMAVRHRQLAVEGVQFHPESVLTPVDWGHRILRNFLAMRSSLSPGCDSHSERSKESVCPGLARRLDTDPSVISRPQNDKRSRATGLQPPAGG